MVEDEYLIAIDMREWLQAAGVDVIGPVPSVEQALALIEDGPIDATVLDVTLRDEAVYAVARRLREHGVPYLFATGEVRIAEGADYRARPKLEKPLFASELLRAVAKLVQG